MLKQSGGFSHVEATFNFSEKCTSRLVQKAERYLQVSLIACNHKQRLLKVTFHWHDSVKLQAPKSFTGHNDRLLPVAPGCAGWCSNAVPGPVSPQSDIASVRYLLEVPSWGEIRLSAGSCAASRSA